jgi:hypothetical protein
MSGSPKWLEEREHAVRLRIRVQPRASRTEVAGEHGDELRIRVASPPVDGEANEALRRFIAKKLGVAVSRVILVAGPASRSKILEVAGADADTVVRSLGGRSGSAS